jgi:hypothetical protein
MAPRQIEKNMIDRDQTLLLQVRKTETKRRSIDSQVCCPLIERDGNAGLIMINRPPSPGKWVQSQLTHYRDFIGTRILIEGTNIRTMASTSPALIARNSSSAWRNFSRRTSTSSVSACTYDLEALFVRLGRHPDAA